MAPRTYNACSLTGRGCLLGSPELGWLTAITLGLGSQVLPERTSFPYGKGMESALEKAP